ncbi:urea transport system ATP-binding protein [Bradyrhizobium japonicum]|jgi:urea transport system ATP-binding protein|uniref:Urea ABC transporter ATP-binding subunit UrtE n=1 Tax=Bradyrhizobium elkanii TaxID=29448 RepID=A0A1E3EIE5_BRAEL|nr:MULTISPECIES: urea ABC transporter ATP-binding subunit UrtE [Bradyrhizobium]MBP1298618.1 urea transport system ATP-binding protein [Bradyrhizobium elkanii]MBP2427706.1 urea transport system ATP-binding protein [Bradyrhizobium elkanii]MCP1730069.1 urea transport system ATP-binding protein [Bradyrhizobium elkanii]MCP1930525.1 urea transport system ATP-binding protein [Bradyrhizobium elkanii]MCP1970904.1 urea transport system ATP-binding protein [Bradyrhizobium elkanii]
MLELTDVDAFYGNSRALQGINLTVGNGEFLSVLGRNGVGKTTLMRSILGLMDRCTGRLSLDGADISPLRTYQRAKAGIAYVPQGRGILPKFTVRENLTLGTFAAKSANGIEEWVLELFPVLKDFLNRYGGNLSGGQQQQLAIARALLAKPKVILLDEPTEGIQPNIVEQIEDVIVSLNRERGITVVLVEQNVAFARRASHRFALLEKGRVVAKGTIGELTDDLIQLHMAV